MSNFCAEQNFGNNKQCLRSIISCVDRYVCCASFTKRKVNIKSSTKIPTFTEHLVADWQNFLLECMQTLVQWYNHGGHDVIDNFEFPCNLIAMHAHCACNSMEFLKI